MTGRERIEAAFLKDGTRDIPAVICYEGIYIRDHWEQLTGYPWWYQEAPNIESQLLWRRDSISRTGQDWFEVPFRYRCSREDRQNISIEVRPEGVYRVNRRTGEEEKLARPHWSDLRGPLSSHAARLPETPDEIYCSIPIPASFDPAMMIEDGTNALASHFVDEFGRDLYTISNVASPLWRTYKLWGFEGMMIMIATRPDLAERACRRLLTLCIHDVREAALLGASGIWVEDCLTDMISPDAYASLNVPFLRQLVGEVRNAGMKSIYYYCGSPAGKWEHIMSVGADALAFEESKKSFTVDIEDVVSRVQGRCVVLGNLDSFGVLQNGTEGQLRAEIVRQLAAGRRNGRRFMMSLGSPVTPGTPVDRVRLYCDLVHELGAT